MFSHSRINCYKQCPKLYQYKYVDKLVPLGSDSKALSIGKAFHHGLEMNSVDEAIKFMDNDEYFTSQSDETDKVIVIAMVEAFLSKFPRPEKYTREIHLVDQTIGFQGYLDGLEETDEGYWLEEDKSTSMLNESYIKKLEFNDQISRYYYLIENVLKLDKPILGVKYRIVKKPLLRQKQSESIEQFRQRLVERLMEPDNIIELIIKRTPEQVQDCMDDTLYDINIINNTTRFVKNLSNCSTMGMCPYIELCSGTPDAINLFNRKEEEQNEPTGEQED